jgi:hypothetical protein
VVVSIASCKQRKSLVNSFVFREAKEIVDRVANPSLTPKKIQNTSNKNTSETKLENYPELNQKPDCLPDCRLDCLTDTPIDTLKNRQSDRHSGRQSENKHLPLPIDIINIERKNDSKFYRQSNRHSDRQSENQSVYKTLRQSDRHSERQSDHNLFHSLTKKQSRILTFLLKNKSCITRYKDVAGSTGIPYGTVRISIRKLVQDKYIFKPVRYHKGAYQGFSYTVNENLCEKFLTSFGADSLTDTPVSLLSSSSLSSNIINKTTTTNYKAIINIFKNHAELGYWKQKGLSVKQLSRWIETAQCSLENMIQYLCYCRYEMVDLGVEDSKPVDNVFNWFFKVIEKIGSYPKPKGYKSLREKQLEEERALVEQKEKEAQETRDLYERRIKAERDKIFYEMLNNPEVELYKKCFENLNDFQKRRKFGKGFETSMRSMFDQILEQEDSYSSNKKSE